VHFNKTTHHPQSIKRERLRRQIGRRRREVVRDFGGKGGDETGDQANRYRYSERRRGEEGGRGQGAGGIAKRGREGEREREGEVMKSAITE